MNTIEDVRKYHAEHSAEFRLRCMLGKAKGLARLAKSDAERDEYLAEATKLQEELNQLIRGDKQ